MDAEITIIGGGVVGLAVSQKLSSEFSNVFVVERHSSFGQETSSRNSEVIHAGLYYPRGSLKSRLCVEGKRLLYDFCREHDVPFNNCGKLVVATSADEISIIEGIRQSAIKNGVDDLRILDRKSVEELEPAVFALAALHSPSTGIVDSHSLMKSFETITINNGGQIVYGSEATGIRRIAGGYEITLASQGDDKYVFTSRIVVNSGGLASDLISQLAGVHDDNLKIIFCKGEYFRLKPPKNKLIGRLVYPVPVHNLEGIGIHVTIEMDGGVKLGPDVTYLEKNIYDYRVDPTKQEAFYRSVKKFLPFVNYEDITPEMAGIRPKIQRPGEPVKDFYIMEESRRGLPGFINLIGIESPGLTASLAIANYVRNLISI